MSTEQAAEIARAYYWLTGNHINDLGRDSEIAASIEQRGVVMTLQRLTREPLERCFEAQDHARNGGT